MESETETGLREHLPARMLCSLSCGQRCWMLPTREERNLGMAKVCRASGGSARALGSNLAGNASHNIDFAS